MQTVKPEPVCQWVSPLEKFAAGELLTAVALDGSTYQAKVHSEGHFVVEGKFALNKSALWRVARTSEVLKASGFEAPSRKVADELKERAIKEGMAEMRKGTPLGQAFIAAAMANMFGTRKPGKSPLEEIFGSMGMSQKSGVGCEHLVIEGRGDVSPEEVKAKVLEALKNMGVEAEIIN